MPYRTILLFGAPGSGKGTQGKALGVVPGFYHCSCGDVFRALDRTSPMGQLFAQYSSSGSLVPDEFTVALWQQTVQAWETAGKFNRQRDILLLDGIPRTLEQTQLLKNQIDVVAIVYLVCNNIDEIVGRLRRRAVSSGRVDDTDEEIIRHRIDVYEEQTRPVLQAYPRSKVVRVNATRPPEQVTADIVRGLEFLKNVISPPSDWDWD
jgi:adenylate kinase